MALERLLEIDLMDNFDSTTRLSTELNHAAYLSEISAVWPNSRTEEEPGRVVNSALKLMRRSRSRLSARACCMRPGGTTSKLAVSRPQASAVAWRSARSDC